MATIPQIWNSTSGKYEQIDAGAIGLADGSSRLTAGQLDNLAKITSETMPSGWTVMGDLDYTYMSTNPNAIKFLKDSVAFVNGYKGVITAGTTYTLNTPPQSLPREDLIFFEMYLNQDNGIPIFRLRTVSDINFTTYPEGVNSPMVKAWGGNTSDTTYTYSKSTTDIGLYISGDGSTSAKTALKSLDGYCYGICLYRVYRRPSTGYASTDEYNIVSPLQNPINTQRVVDGDRVGHEKDVLGVKIEGHTLVNLLLDAGNCESAPTWSPIPLDSSIKLFGNNSLKIAITNTSLSNNKNILCDQTHKYLLSYYVYISSYTSGSLGVWYSDYNSYAAQVPLMADYTKLNQWQRKSVVVTGKSGGGIRLQIGSATASTLTANIDGICVYDLTQIYGAGNEPTDIPTLERALPFVDSMKASKPVAVKATGKNVINEDDLLGYSSGASGGACTKNGNGTLKYKNSTGSGGFSNKAYAKLKPNTVYTAKMFNITKTTGSVLGRIQFLAEDKSVITTYFVYDTGDAVTFTSPNIFYKVQVDITTANTNSIGESDFNIQLEEGTTASTYQPYKASQLILPSDFVDSLKEVSSTVKDSVDLQRGKLTKKVGSVVLNGQESWDVSINGTTNILFRNVLPISGKASYPSSIISDSRFPYTVAWNDTSEHYYLNTTEILLCIAKSRLTTQDVAGFKAWLQANPVTVFYELATPVEYDISDFLKGRLYVNPENTTVETEQVTTKKVAPVANPNLVTNGDFSNGTTGWSNVLSTTPTVSSNICSFLATGQYGRIQTSVTCNVGDKIYRRGVIKATSNLVGIGATSGMLKYHSGNGAYETISTVDIVNASTAFYISVVDYRTSGWDAIYVQQMYSANLTQMFGTGNEPSKEWCDKYLEFGTNYTVKAPSGSTALSVQRDNKDVFNSVQGQVALIPASKWKEGTYELFYREPAETHVPPRVTIGAGNLSLDIKDSATVGSIVLTNTEVPFKKHVDGGLNYKGITFTYPNTLPNTAAQWTINNQSEYDALREGDILTSVYANSARMFGYQWIKIISKDDNVNRKVTITSMDTWGANMSNFYKIDRFDGLRSDITDKEDITNLWHQVSLTGWDYSKLLLQEFDRFCRSENVNY